MSNSTRIIVGLLALLFLFAIGREVLAAQNRVLIVYSYEKELAWTQQCDEGIRKALPQNVLIDRFYMATKRIPQEEFESKAAEALEEFKRIQPDLVILSDDNALRLLGPEISAAGVPVVYLGINGNPREYFETLPDNVAGVIERIPLLHWVRILFDIVPKADSLYVMLDGSPTADAIIKSAFQGRSSINYDNKNIYWEQTTDWESWKRAVLDADEGIILMPIYHALKDSEGVHVPMGKVISWTAANSRVPVFATQDYAVGEQGVVGALVVVGEEHGFLAGTIAKKALEGVPLHQLSVLDDQKGAYYFNKNQLRRYKLTLPKRIREMANYR